MHADAIVIGAGAAGLAAARRLATGSLDVIVLEGRDRVGGRVWSQRTARRAVPAELGAEFIHGEASETMTLLREAGTAAIDTAGEVWAGVAGEPLNRTDDDFPSAAGIFRAAASLAQDESVEAFLGRFGDDERMRQSVRAARAFVEGFDAADPAVASVRAIADEWMSGVDFAAARPLGGYRPVFDSLHTACVEAGVQMCLSTIVQRIEWRRGHVAVFAHEAGGRQRTFRARCAIVTIPVGVLKDSADRAHVVFEPPLPPSTTNAIACLEMGDVVKVTLSFRTAFWERIAGGRYLDAAYFRAERQPFTVYWTQYPVRSELIVAWVGGPAAAALRGLSREDLIARAVEGFGRTLGDVELARSELDEAYVHDWAADPFARGAYSYVRVAGDEARAVLGAPLDDVLFFAGEATSPDGQGGTVNGALKTGERAAREAMAALARTPVA